MMGMMGIRHLCKPNAKSPQFGCVMLCINALPATLRHRTWRARWHTALKHLKCTQTRQKHTKATCMGSTSTSSAGHLKAGSAFTTSDEKTYVAQEKRSVGIYKYINKYHTGKQPNRKEQSPGFKTLQHKRKTCSFKRHDPFFHWCAASSTHSCVATAHVRRRVP